MNISKSVKEELSEISRNYYKYKRNSEEDKIYNMFLDVGLDTLGGDCLGSGSGRNVYDMTIFGYSDYIFKIATPHSKYDGLNQNKREIQIWRSCSKEQRKFLAPVIDSDPECYWLVMPKGKKDVRIDYEWKRDAEYHLRDIVWDKDIREENIVCINGNLKICDYGTSEKSKF